MTKAISFANFSFLGCQDLVLQRGLENTPSAATGGKSPVLLGLIQAIAIDMNVVLRIL